MKQRILCLLSFIMLQHGCATGYTLVTPGTVAIGDMSVSSSTIYNLAPSMALPEQRKGAQVWTRDGLLLDSLTFVPAVPDGEALLVTRQKDAALPVFRKSMLPNEVEELVESTIAKDFGEGNAAVSTANLRPHRFGDDRGILFDVSAKVSDSPEYRGLVGAFIADDKLYAMWYLAADPHYFKKHQEAAESIIKSARIARL